MRFSILESSAIESLLVLNAKLVRADGDKTRRNPMLGAAPYYMPKCAKKSLKWDDLKKMVDAIRAAVIGVSAAKDASAMKAVSHAFRATVEPIEKHFNVSFIDTLCRVYNMLGAAAEGFDTDHRRGDL